MNKLTIAAIALLLSVAAAQDKPKPPSLDEATQNKLLKAQHAKDQADAKMATLGNEWTQIQAQQRDLQEQAKTIQQQISEAQKNLEAEKDAAYKAANVDKAKYDLEVDKMVFNPKTTAAPVSPSPEKK